MVVETVVANTSLIWKKEPVDMDGCAPAEIAVHAGVEELVVKVPEADRIKNELDPFVFKVVAWNVSQLEREGALFTCDCHVAVVVKVEPTILFTGSLIRSIVLPQ